MPQISKLKHIPLYLATMAATLLMLSACNPSIVYSENQGVDETGWDLGEKLTYHLDIDDTLCVYDLFVDLRIARNYPYCNSFLFLKTTFPSGSVAIDTLECPLAYDDGKWRGKKSGQYIDNRYYFKKHVIFPQKGTYTFDITHGMRDTAIVGIRNVGLVMKLAEKE